MSAPADKDRSTGLRSIILALLPPRVWRVPVFFLIAVGAGIGVATLHVSNATSYLSDDPRACINCHIMEPQFATWERGSHGKVATCNDCHVPHDSLLRKYAFKARDGTRHGFMFTFRMEPQVIKMHEPGQKVVQENCVRCHEHLVTTGTNHLAVSLEEASHGAGQLCWDCHRETPHGRVHSLSATQWARVPAQDPVLPAWLTDALSHPLPSPDETSH